MIYLRRQALDTIHDVHAALQKAIQLELATLPPYCYALFTLSRDANQAARQRIQGVVMEEMVHMALACNILNAIGGTPVIAKSEVVPTYPGPLPYDIGGQGEEPLIISLLPFSPEAMDQAMHIEEPEEPLEFPAAALEAPTFQTIGQFYAALCDALKTLPAQMWASSPRNQLGDHSFLAGQLFAVTDFASASTAIERIVSEGEGNTQSPLDFQGEVAHYYRFQEIRDNKVLERDPSARLGYRWGQSLGIDWSAAAPAIPNPGEHDFSGDEPARAAQDACDRAFTVMLSQLDGAVNGTPAHLGNAVRAMFDLRMAAIHALDTPLAGSKQVAGPAFRFRPELI